MPVRRIEKPVYFEDKQGNIKILRQDIQFVGKKIEMTFNNCSYMGL